MNDLDIEEDLARRRLDRRVLSRIIALALSVWPWILALAGVQIIMVASIFLRPWFIGQVIDHGVVADAQAPGHSRADWTVIAWMASGLTLAWMARFGLAGVSQWCGAQAATRALNNLRIQVFAHVQRLSVAYFDRTRAGRIISRADRDVDALEPVMVNGPPEVLSMILRMAGAIAFLWWQDVRFVYILIGPVIILGLGAAAFQRLGGQLWARTAECKSRVTALLVESITGIAVIQGATAERDCIRRYDTLLNDLDRSAVIGAWGWGWFAPFTSMLWACGLAGVLWLGIQDVATGRLTAGQLTQCLFYVILFLGPVQELGDLFEKIAAGVASGQRIFLLLDTPAEPRPVHPIVPTALKGRIRMSGVRFGYNPEREVLHGINLVIAPGERVAVVGATGSGKSTLVQLLNRFYQPSAGTIHIDDYDLAELDSAAVRRHIGVVLQDNALFSGTVLDNLRIADATASDERLQAAVRALGADDILERLPQGLHTHVGPNGSRLSHGQRQLVCLIRAFIADPAILVLDEATSAVDLHTEARIRAALGRLCAGRTAIIIAHRLATVEDCSRVVVMADGRICEDGDPVTLRSGNGIFAALSRTLDKP